MSCHILIVSTEYDILFISYFKFVNAVLTKCSKSKTKKNNYIYIIYEKNYKYTIIISVFDDVITAEGVKTEDDVEGFCDMNDIVDLLVDGVEYPIVNIFAYY